MQRTSKPSPAGSPAQSSLARSSPALKSRTFRCMGTVISLALPARRCRGRRGRAGGCHGRRRTRVCRPGRHVQPLPPRFRGQPAGPRRGHAPGRLGGLPCPLRGRHRLAAADRRVLHTRAARRRAGPLRNHQGLRHRPGSRGAGVRRHRGLVPQRRRRRAGERLARAGNRVPVAGRHRGSAGPPDRCSRAFPLGGTGRFAALATSGTAERGNHIWRAGADRARGGRAGLGPLDFRQVSVAAADILTADVLATAVVAGGRRMLDWATDSWDVEVLAVLGSGELLATPGFRA